MLLNNQETLWSCKLTKNSLDKNCFLAPWNASKFFVKKLLCGYEICSEENGDFMIDDSKTLVGLQPNNKATAL